MKNDFVKFLLGLLLLIPTSAFSQKQIYVKKTNSSTTTKPKRNTFDDVAVSANQVTGDLVITFSSVLYHVDVQLLSSSEVLEESHCTVTSAGQSITYYVGDYDDGEYFLSIEINGEQLIEYTIEISEETDS